MTSPLEILRIGPDADEAEIHRAYRDRVKEAHPDQGGSVREFQLVQAAYEEIRTGNYGDLETELETTGEGGDEDGAADEGQRREGYRVEYLDYEALNDEGWGIADDDLFEKASGANLAPADYGQILVEPHETLLEAAENRGFSWPFACRGGACANCAVAVVEGSVEMPSNHVLTADMLERGIRLSCISMPVTDDMKVVYNIKHLPGLDELRLPAYRFKGARSGD